jgi:hypothetical protein
MPIILATQEAEIRNHSSKLAEANSLRETLSQKNPREKRLLEWLMALSSNTITKKKKKKLKGGLNFS